jgi:hypothetical protein
MRGAKWTVLVIVAVVAVAAVSVGVWQLGWFVTQKNVDRAGQVAQHSYSRQVGLTAQIDRDAATVADIDVQLTTATPDQTAALSAQRHAIVGSICDAASNLNDTAQPNRAAQSLIVKECSK